MQQAAHLTSPTVNIYRASPSPTPSSSQSMIAQSPFTGGVWPSMGGDFLSALPRNFQDPRYHKRASSGSSIASTGPESPHQAHTYHPRIATSDANYSPSRNDFDYSPQIAKNPYSMPDSMMYGGNPAFAGIDMTRIHSLGHDDRVSYGGPQSVSTISHRNSPATPQTWDDSYGDDKQLNGNLQSAAFQQSLQDVFPDQNAQYMQYNSKAMNNHRHTLQEQFTKSQQQHLRTGSPTSNPRERSPFKPTSTMMAPVQKPQQQIPQLQKQRTSISPKELMLDENEIEDNQPSLFGDRSNFNRQTSNLSQLYSVPSFTQESSVQIPQQYPFVSSQGSQNIPDSTPDFPAHMISMESTNEEGPSEPSSQQSIHRNEPRFEPTSRPVDTSAGGGTYSCTYHGCPQRFDSPAKLQKHKREGHRSTESAGTTNLSTKNSQAGPHRCDRINPSTGKSCNSIFSRPYDLTRHEDTIHNNRKMKVRCHFCTEEKTFSRNDALTRHMRVVHPDLEVAGRPKKQRPLK